MLQTLLAADRRADRAQALETYALDLLEELIKERRKSARWRAFADAQLRKRLESDRKVAKVYEQIAEMRVGIRRQESAQ